MNTFLVFLKDQNSRFTCPHNNNTVIEWYWNIYHRSIWNSFYFRCHKSTRSRWFQYHSVVALSFLFADANMSSIQKQHFNRKDSIAMVYSLYYSDSQMRWQDAGDYLLSYFTPVYFIKGFGKKHLQSYNDFCNELFYTTLIWFSAKEIGSTTTNPFYCETVKWQKQSWCHLHRF